MSAHCQPCNLTFATAADLIAHVNSTEHGQIEWPEDER